MTTSERSDSGAGGIGGGGGGGAGAGGGGGGATGRHAAAAATPAAPSPTFRNRRRDSGSLSFIIPALGGCSAGPLGSRSLGFMRVPSRVTKRRARAAWRRAG